MRGSPSILLRFRNGLYKFNNTGAGMFGSVYHTLLKLKLIQFEIEVFRGKNAYSISL